MAASSTLASILASIIYILHLLLLVYVCVGPFISDKLLLMLYIMAVPFIQLHWVTNNDTCALTVAECALRGIKPDKSFFHKLVSPVYKLNEKTESILLWIISFALWLIAVHRYYKLYEK